MISKAMKRLLGGSTAIVTPLPNDAPTGNEQVIFTTDNVREAIAIMQRRYHADHHDPIKAMREVMMFSLRCAAINLNVK